MPQNIIWLLVFIEIGTNNGFQIRIAKLTLRKRWLFFSFLAAKGKLEEENCFTWVQDRNKQFTVSNKIRGYYDNAQF